MSRNARSLSLGALIGALSFCGCTRSIGTDTGNPALPKYVADNPQGALNGAGASSDSGGLKGDEAGRLIEQAERIELHGDRLYGIADNGQLFVIDVSRPEQLRLLGKRRMPGYPVELYVDEASARVLVLFNVWSSAFDADGRRFAVEGGVVMLDVSDPAQIEERAQLMLPGSIAGSRRAGSLLYVVTFEGDPTCADCAPASTAVSSIAIGDDELRLVDSEHIEDGSALRPWPDVIGFGAHSIYLGMSVTNATPGNQGAALEVIDASGADGAVVRGARVPIGTATGALAQVVRIDEHGDMLRVVSDAGGNSVGPSTGEGLLETFRIESSRRITPLGSLVVPSTAVTFDGERAYAVSHEQGRPLLALDLADPAAPVVRGQLAWPGFVQHIEPRGDRLFVLGYELSHPEGALSLALVDATDLGALQLRSKVHFGQSDAGEFPNEPGRSPELTIDETAGLALVPYKTWEKVGDSSLDAAECTRTPRHGVQIVELAQDALHARGDARVQGIPRRALLHRDALVTVSSEAVQSFDLADRAAPQERSSLRVGRFVFGAVQMGDKLVRLSHDLETHRDERLDVVALDDAENPESLGELALDPLREQLPPPRGFEPSCLFAWIGEVDSLFAHGDHVYMLSLRDNRRLLSVFDLRDASAPRFVRFVELPFGSSSGHEGDIWMAPGSREALLVGDKLVIAYSEQDYDETGNRLTRNQGFIAVVDLAQPSEPRLVAQIARPDSLAHGGLLAAGSLVVSTRLEAIPNDPKRVKIFVDRLDLHDPDAPELLAPLDVPGFLIDYDPARAQLLTLDVHLSRALASNECGAVAASLSRDDECYEVAYTLSELAIDGDGARRTSETPIEGALTSVAASATRVVVARVDGPFANVSSDLLPGQPEPPPPPSAVLGFERIEGELEPGAVANTFGLVYGLQPIPGAEARFRFSRGGAVEQLDLRALDAPKIAPYAGPGRGFCYVPTPQTSPSVLCIGGPSGLERLELVDP